VPKLSLKQAQKTYSNCHLLQIKDKLNGIRILPSKRRFSFEFEELDLFLIQRTRFILVQENQTTQL
jgi:hypothetical protein